MVSERQRSASQMGNDSEGHQNKPATPAWVISMLGALLSIVVIYPVNLAFINGLGNPSAIIVTVPVEEIFKLLGVIFLVFRYPESLADKASGAKLGGLAGLTFGLLETVVNRSGLLGIIFSTPMHIVSSGLIGMGLVFAAGKRRKQSRSDVSVLFGMDTLTFFLIALALHYLYNFLAFSLQLPGILIGLSGTFVVFYLLYRYLPQDFNTIQVADPLQLLSDTFHSRRISAGEKPKANAFCTQCGRKLEEVWSVCPNCGKTIKSK